MTYDYRDALIKRFYMYLRFQIPGNCFYNYIISWNNLICATLYQLSVLLPHSLLVFVIQRNLSIVPTVLFPDWKTFVPAAIGCNVFLQNVIWTPIGCFWLPVKIVQHHWLPGSGFCHPSQPGESQRLVGKVKKSHSVLFPDHNMNFGITTKQRAILWSVL